MFDRLVRRRKRYERHLLDLDDEEFLTDSEEQRYQADMYNYKTPMGELARMADDVEAGRVELPPRWKLDRPSPGVQVWTTPSGRRYACDPVGELLPLPDDEAPFQWWTSW